MKNITYEVKFFSNWHCGSGQAAGADVDELPIKDHDGLPFIPGRTIKGLLRDACDDLKRYDELVDEDINEVFGYFDNKETFTQGTAFFSDAILPEGDRQAIIDGKLAPMLFQSISSTAIDEDGIAKDHSLRKVQTVVPCVLTGKIHNVPDGFVPRMGKAVKLVKRLGLGRSHGAGRCSITITKEEDA